MPSIDFLKDHPECDYPDPDLSSLTPTGNMDNIGLLTRHMKIKWPQFSWQVIDGDEKTRLYQKFCEDISRVGYDQHGQIWSIICPQFGDNLANPTHDHIGNKNLSKMIGEGNVEVTVTGVRGWIDEGKGHLSADVSAEGKMWFTSKNNRIANALGNFMGNCGNFPFVKGKAVVIPLHAENIRNRPLSRFKNGSDPNVTEPVFTQHKEEAKMVGHISMQVGNAIPVEGRNAGNINAVNELLVDIGNLRFGNMMAAGKIIKWNIWLDQPEDVNRTEWQNHAEHWRDSLELDGVTPVELKGESNFQLTDGSIVHPMNILLKHKVATEVELLCAWVRKHISPSSAMARIDVKDDPFTQEDRNVLLDLLKD